MPFLKKPKADALRAYIERQAEREFSYAAVGATAATPPAGFVVDHTRVKLGNGEAVFLAAKEALENWWQIDLGWIEAWPPTTPIELGADVVTVVKTMGLWWVNTCRIVYVIDDEGPVRRFGFAYGTLSGHVECGEERFLIEWNRDDDTVWYDILAFSRPARLVARLGYPLVRRLQKRFGRVSAAAMVRLAGNRSR